MLYKSSGTSVPQSLESPHWWQNVVDSVFVTPPEQPPLPGIKGPRKSPIIAVSLRPLPNLEFEVTIARLKKKPKVYSVGFLSATRLVAAVNNCRYGGGATVCPSVAGWTAYLDIPVKKPVYPPPGEVQR